MFVCESQPINQTGRSNLLSFSTKIAQKNTVITGCTITVYTVFGYCFLWEPHQRKVLNKTAFSSFVVNCSGLFCFVYLVVTVCMNNKDLLTLWWPTSDNQIHSHHLQAEKIAKTVFIWPSNHRYKDVSVGGKPTETSQYQAFLDNLSCSLSELSLFSVRVVFYWSRWS